MTGICMVCVKYSLVLSLIIFNCVPPPEQCKAMSAWSGILRTDKYQPVFFFCIAVRRPA